MSQTATNTASKCYQHSNKAGNRGDVWKHYALAKILENEAVRETKAYIETHAGAGVYELKDIPKAREWKQGILKVARRPEVTKEPFQAILKKVNPSLTFPGCYPGSAFIASRLLPGRRCILFETDPKAAKKLRLWIPEADVRDVREEDGWRGLAKWAQEESRPGEQSIVVVDPPYKSEKDWKMIQRRLTGWPSEATVVIWYHVVAYSRPNELRFWCQMRELRCWAVECIVDAPRAKPSRKPKGSGLLVLNLPNPKLYKELVSLAACLADLMKCEGERPDPLRHWYL